MIKCQNKSHNKLFIVADEKRDLRIKGCLQGPQAGGCPSGGMPKRGLPPPPPLIFIIYTERAYGLSCLVWEILYTSTIIKTNSCMLSWLTIFLLNFFT